MADKIKIDLISDVVCPWCVIGYKRLAQAIAEMRIQDRVELDWQPFELNPAMPAEGEEGHAYSARKYGATREESTRSRANIAQLGAELGFKFDFFDGMKIVNTRDAHVLLDFAKEAGQQTALQMRLFEAFFSERKDVSDRSILTQAVQEVGLNAADALARLSDGDARQRMQTQAAHWLDLGVSSVPTVVFNGSSVLAGARPVDLYKQVLAKLLAQSPEILS